MPNASTTRALVDTSFIVGLVDPRDVWHARARALYQALEQKQAELAYPDCVVSEAVNVLARRSEERGRSQEFLRLLELLGRQIPPSTITWTYPHVRQWYERILEGVRESQGRLNFHDALLVLAAREMGVTAIVSFDQDFDQVGGIVRLHRPRDVT